MNPIDLLTRLVDSLAENAPLEAETEALLAEARRAIKEWRVIDAGECTIESPLCYENPKSLYTKEPGAPIASAVLCSALIDAEAKALTTAPHGPCTVTILVRVAGER